MSNYAIKVEGLGKSYLIRHNREPYTALRDVLAARARQAGRWLLRRPSGGSGANLEEFWALKDISLEVQPGERLGIVGANGAGKTTLLKVLSRITEPTRGRVRLRGRVGSLLEVGTGFHPELTGRENIYLNGAILGMSRAEIRRKFDEIVDFAGVEQFLDTPVKRYSSGMYVRLAFSVAAHLEPEILLVDEVLAVGDAEFQKKSIGKMRDVSHSGRTILFVSHNMAAVQRLCQRGVHMEKGELVSVGPIESVVSRYLQERTAGIADSQFNSNEREGSGWARVTDMFLMDGNDRRVNSLPNDVDLSIQVQIEVVGDVPRNATLQGLLVELMFFNENAQPLMSVMSVDHDGPQLPATQRCRLEMRLPAPTFVPGKYRVDAFLGIPYREHVDLVRNALSFTILPPLQPWRPFDLYSVRGHVTRKTSWQLVDSGEEVGAFVPSG